MQQTIQFGQVVQPSVLSSVEGIVKNLEAWWNARSETFTALCATEKYDDAVTYTRTGLLIPLVYYDNGSRLPANWNAALQCWGLYYYLNADTSTGTAPSDASGNPWTKTNDFGVVITQGIFAEGGKLGRGVFNGDYFFSMNGRIGATDYLAGATVGDTGLPAYAWFKGDPAASHALGTLSKSAFSTNVQPLMRFTLFKGMTVRFVLEGRDSAGYTDMVGVQRYAEGIAATGYLASVTFSSPSFVRKTLEHTATATGEYVLGYSHSASLGESSHTLYVKGSYSFANVFEPNWWVDLLTGKESGAKGNFVIDANGGVFVRGNGEFTGTVKADNFFRTLAVSSRGRRTIVVGGSGEDTVHLYIPSDIAASEYGHAFAAGTYLTAGEFESLVDSGSVDNWKTDDGIVAHTGPADEVLLTDNNSTGVYSGTVYLPRCQDYTGKTVIVRHTVTSGTNSATVKQADGASVFVAGGTLNGFALNTGTNPNPYDTLAKGQTAIFYSTGSRWMCLAKW